jgi:hypothetical protein
MSIIESIYNYLLTYPNLRKNVEYDDVDMYIDYSKNDEVTTYSISEVPCNPVTKTYVSGNTVNQFLFNIVSVENYGSDKDNNISNIAFFEDFSKWIKENNKYGIFPAMDEDKKTNKIECLTGGYMLDNSTDGRYARYVIQMKLTYDQKN